MATVLLWMYYLTYILVSSIFFLVVCDVFSPILSGLVTETYQGFTKERKKAWNIRFTSTINGIIIGFLCIYSLSMEDFGDKLSTIPWITKLNICVAWGYFIIDMFWMTVIPKESGAELNFIFHHLFSMLGFFLILQENILGFFVTVRLISELSQPFIHSRYFLINCEMKQSRQYLVVTILFCLFFFVFRVLTIPYYYLNVRDVYGTEAWNNISLPVHIVWLSVSGFLDCLNCYWFTLMIKGISRRLGFRRQTKTEEN